MRVLGAIRRLFLLSAFLSVAALAVGQPAPTGRILGKVTDTTGGVLPGVTVEARLLSGGMVREAATSMTGEYAIEGMPPGRYQLSFGSINFASVVHKDINVGAGPSVVPKANVWYANCGD